MQIVYKNISKVSSAETNGENSVLCDCGLWSCGGDPNGKVSCNEAGVDSASACAGKCEKKSGSSSMSWQQSDNKIQCACAQGHWKCKGTTSSPKPASPTSIPEPKPSSPTEMTGSCKWEGVVSDSSCGRKCEEITGSGRHSWQAMGSLTQCACSEGPWACQGFDTITLNDPTAAVVDDWQPSR
eukprot:CAMPEP_0196599190 /NCGR_PEP_ID=MMETSP1081-20130531/94728_1 /TAXON_ID=36882 /ORGANISM="Pyramimonas amylifera, Strain CCMP720" /LENGTH=182 /DNA_ID=CAMNT_0041924949 /DNA_START=452 /DNA_END=1000 /DNA_ORIENTATION=+